MATVIDNRNDPYGPAASASKGIIRIIESATEAKKAQFDLQKEVMLHQIQQKMDLQNQEKEFQQNMGHIPQVQAANEQLNNPMGGLMNPGNGLNEVGKADAGTSAQVGSTPPLPGQPTPAMSMINPAQQPQNDAQSQMSMMPQGQPQQPQQVQPQYAPMIPQGVQIDSPTGSPLPPPKSPITIGSDGRPVYKQLELTDKTYAEVYKKWRSGVPLSMGEKNFVQEHLGMKGMANDLFGSLGIDTVNQSPEQIGAELKVKNPGQYATLEALKDGKINIAGRQSKEMNKMIQDVQTIWPGTDTTVVKSRMDLRKDFTAGKTASTVDALNTALLHGDNVATLLQKVNNRGLLVQNKLGNLIKQQTNDPDLLALKDAMEKYNRESAKAIAGSGQVYVDELKNQDNQLNDAQSIDGAISVIKNRMKLFGGRTTPLAERWQRTFGEDSPAPVLGPNAQKILNKYGYQYDKSSGDIAEAQADGRNGSISLPPEVKTTSQAVSYLTQQGMSKDQAIQWIRSQ